MRSAMTATARLLLAISLLTPMICAAQQQVVPTPPPPTTIPTPPQPAAVPEVVPPERPPARAVQRQAVPRRQQPSTKQATPARAATTGNVLDACPEGLADQCRVANSARIAYAAKYYESLAGDLELRRRAFRWHEFSTKALFWCVIAITALGLVLSWREFGKYYNQRGTRGGRQAESGDGASVPAGAEAPPQSVFKVGAQGLEVTSSLIGFLVLAVSLVFFYLYIVNVYPLYELQSSDQASSTAKESRGTGNGK